VERKLLSVLKSNPSPADAVYQLLVDPEALSVEAAALIEECEKLRKRSEFLSINYLSAVCGIIIRTADKLSVP
jgi:hypothetical protein